eukprot:scaffold9780_cov136-Skeletonema_dohrnii-CCMP3373.AAC.3
MMSDEETKRAKKSCEKCCPSTMVRNTCTTMYAFRNASLPDVNRVPGPQQPGQQKHGGIEGVQYLDT